MCRFPLRLMGVLAVALMNALAQLVGCGSDRDTLPPGTGPTPTTTGTADAGPLPWTPGNVCERLPHELCSRRQSCCLKTRPDADMELCEARVRHECEIDIHQVLQGYQVFRPELIPVCLEAISPRLEVCQSKPTETAALLKAEAPCRQIFEGGTQVGDGCLVSGECAQLPPPSLGVICDDELAVCVEKRIGTVFDGCGDTLSQGGRTSCEQGLYCQPAPWSPDFWMCAEAVRLNYPCVLSGPQYVPCELGTYCGGGPLSCQPSQADGTACSSDAECLSHRCPFGVCAPALTPVTDKECGVPCSDSSCP